MLRVSGGRDATPPLTDIWAGTYPGYRSIRVCSLLVIVVVLRQCAEGDGLATLDCGMLAILASLYLDGHNSFDSLRGRQPAPFLIDYRAVHHDSAELRAFRERRARPGRRALRSIPVVYVT